MLYLYPKFRLLLRGLEEKSNMNNSVKYFIYIAGSVLVFFFIIKSMYGPSSVSTNQAVAFEWEKETQVYFLDSKKINDSNDCSEVTPVYRKVLNAETLGPGTLEALLQGPTEEERVSGLITSINKGVLIQKFEIKNRVAYVDFDTTFNSGVAGSCTVLAIRSQIESTLNALPDIDSVIISVNGESEGILEP